MIDDKARNEFWQDAFAYRGSVTPYVLQNVAMFGLFAAAICLVSEGLERWGNIRIGLEVAPHEVVGAALGLLLILRTNAGYDRWWEARKLWGGIVNQSRNLVIGACAYGPDDSEWQNRFVRWAAAFPHVARAGLRQQPPPEEIVPLIGPAEQSRLAQSDHPASVISWELARQLRAACDQSKLDRFAFLQIDRERAQLIDHLGGCERILKTPLPKVYAIKIRRFITIFLMSLPLALLHRMQSEWLVPLVTMLVAYPLLALDRIGAELQNPFSEQNLSHLPLTDITAGIERNIQGIAHEQSQRRPSIAIDR